MSPVIEVHDLRKSYDSIVAVNGISFEVQQGEIFGMVGPNGAGKTTTIECIEGLRRPDHGSIRVLDLHPLRDRYQLRRRIGIQLQESNLPDRMKVWEALDLFATIYDSAIDWLSILERLGLLEKENAYFAKLSGGQKQRVFIALALVNDPELIFLDELTMGLDPQARHAMWDLVRDLRYRGNTVFLTTHYMEEAERLCDRVAILDHGKIVALDRPENLIRDLVEEKRAVFSVDGDFDTDSLLSLESVRRIRRSGDMVVVYGEGEDLLSELVLTLESQGVRCRDSRTEKSSLEDVFLALTGKEMRD